MATKSTGVEKPASKGAESAELEQDTVSAELKEAEELDSLIKQRTFARGYVTRYGKKVMELCAKEGEDILPLLQVAMGSFDKQVTKLEDIQEQIERLLPIEAVESELDSVSNYTEAKVDPVRNAATKKMSTQNQAESVTSASSISSISGKVEAKLPKIELKKFSGDVQEWKEFWGLFQVTVDCGNLADVTKFTYLKSLLKGEARSVVAGLAVTGEKYKTACYLLEQRFGRDEQIRFAHIHAVPFSYRHTVQTIGTGTVGDI